MRHHKVMRSIVTLLAFVTVVGGIALSPAPAHAAACAAPSKSYGTATMQLNIPVAGTYSLWTRMNVPDATNNSYLMEVDGTQCYVVGDSGITAKTWTWVNHQNATAGSRISMNLSAGTHTIKAIGREPSVKFDRILAVSDQNCTPTTLGDNCMATTDTVKPTVTLTQPDALASVNGVVAIKATASDNVGVSKVEFYIQNALKATSTVAPYEYKWDTKSVVDGSYTIMSKAYDIIGNSSFDTRNVTVKNTVAQPPSAPLNITAKATQPTEVTLNWQPGSSATGVKYRIIRNNVAVATVDALSYVDKAVLAGTKYSYHVVAVDANNLTSQLPANPVVVTTPALPAKDTAAPTKPANVAAAVVSTTQINVSWRASTDNVGVKSYDLYRAKGSAAATKIASITGITYGDSALSSGTEYSYYVIAKDAAGNASAASDKARATTKATPPVVQRPGVLRGTVKSTSGRPLAGAKITVWLGSKRYQATTNWRGQYLIAKIPAGKYQVKVAAKSYVTKTYAVQINAGKTKWLDVTLRR